MNLYPDLQSEVLLDSANIIELRNLCSTNRSYFRICNDDSFWEQWFAKNGIPIMKSQRSYQAWWNEYEWSEKAYIEAGNLYNKLVNREIHGDMIMWNLLEIQCIEDITLLFLNNRAPLSTIIRKFKEFPNEDNTIDEIYVSSRNHPQDQGPPQMWVEYNAGKLYLYVERYGTFSRIYQRMIQDDQAIHILYIIIYYSIDMYNVNNDQIDVSFA